MVEILDMHFTVSLQSRIFGCTALRVSLSHTNGYQWITVLTTKAHVFSCLQIRLVISARFLGDTITILHQYSFQILQII